MSGASPCELLGEVQTLTEKLQGLKKTIGALQLALSRQDRSRGGLERELEAAERAHEVGAARVAALPGDHACDARAQRGHTALSRAPGAARAAVWRPEGRTRRRHGRRAAAVVACCEIIFCPVGLNGPLEGTTVLRSQVALD